MMITSSGNSHHDHVRSCNSVTVRMHAFSSTNFGHVG